MPPYSTSLRTSRPRGSRENASHAAGASCGRRAWWMVMFIAVMLGGLLACRFSIPDRSRHLLRDARRHAGHRPRRVAPIIAGRHADELGEARAERAEGRAADCEAHLGDTELAATQQRHRALDATRHQIRVRRLAVGEPELAAEMPSRHVRAACKRF